MIDWWNTLAPMMKVLWAVTLSASLIFLIQTIMTFLGLGGHGDVDGVDMDFDSADASFDADPSMNLLTFRNFVNFCLGFGWTAVLLSEKISSTTLLLFVATLAGIALFAAVMMLFKWLSGMQQSGNISLKKSAVGCGGTSYLPLPGERGGTGKVQITINNAVREYDAITEGPAIKTGVPIRVVEVINESTLLVETEKPTII